MKRFDYVKRKHDGKVFIIDGIGVCNKITCYVLCEVDNYGNLLEEIVNKKNKYEKFFTIKEALDEFYDKVEVN